MPEELGGIRNWDYRFAWPRDASIGIGAFLGAGKDREARMFLAWLLHASRLDRPRLPVLLTLHGKHPRRERTLDGWPGYADSRPVRVGNGAADQHQLDGYGWVIDAAWLAHPGRQPALLRDVASRARLRRSGRERWREPDAGIWEIRGDPQHHVHSKLMAWLALDRALRIADTHRLSSRRRQRWRRRTRRDRRRRAEPRVRRGTRQLHAQLRLRRARRRACSCFRSSASSRRARRACAARSTRSQRDLDAGGPLLYRYPPGRDGLPGTEGAFLPCAFWLVQALAETGRIAEATDRFEALLQLATPLGLYAEEMDPTSREHLGNYPQALTHAALVQPALAIRDGASPA